MTTKRISVADWKIFENLVWTHKIHEKEVEVCEPWTKAAKFATIFFALAALVLIYIEQEGCISTLVAGGVFTLLNLGVLLFYWGFNPEEKFSQNRMVAKTLLPLRDEFASAILDYEAGKLSENDYLVVRNIIMGKLHVIYALAPQTHDSAVGKAGNGVESYLKVFER